MAVKDKDEISQGDRKAYAKKPTVKYVVSGGSIFVFDMGAFISEGSPIIQIPLPSSHERKPAVYRLRIFTKRMINIFI